MYKTLFPLVVWLVMSVVPPVESATYELPVWLKGKEHLLPPVDPEDVAKFRTNWEIFYQNEGRGADAEKAGPIIAKMGDKASTAAIWYYVQEDSVNGAYGHELWRIRLMDIYRDDPIIAQWIMPIVRARMDYIESRIGSAPFPELCNSQVLSDLVNTVYPYGTDEDYERFLKFHALHYEGVHPDIRGPQYPREAHDKDRVRMQNGVKTRQKIAQRYAAVFNLTPVQPDQVAGASIANAVEKDVPKPATQTMTIHETPPTNGSRERFYLFAGAALLAAITVVWWSLSKRK